jgi:predicted RNase H-related nuclease YkuK (DUF458 family)
MDSKMTFVEKVKERMRTASKSSTFYIGCDSSVTRKKTGMAQAHYALVFIVHHNSANGASIIAEHYYQPDFGNLKQRMLSEVNYAIALATQIVDDLDGRKLEIHFDINSNPKHKSHVAVKEALAYAKGMGLEAKVKPDSFAASHAADHLT